MKHNWEYKKIKDITSLFTDGDWIESKDQSVSGIRLVQTGNIGDGFYIGKEDRPHFISEETFERLKCTEIFEGDCLISRLPQPLGRSCLLPKLDCRTITAVDCSILRFKNICDSHYFVYYTQSSKYQNTVDINATGTTRKRISRKNLENMSVPIPPLPIQQSIVSELDSLSKIIADCKETLKDYDALEQSIFYDMFGDPVKNEKGWEVKKLGEVCSKITDGVHSKPKYVESGVPFVSVKDITTGELIMDDVKYISKEDHIQYSKRCPIEFGDVLYTKVGATYGRPALVNVKDEFSLYVSVALLKPIHKVVNNQFLCKQLSTDFVKRQADSSIKGIGVPDLHLNMIKNFVVLVPPMHLQLSFNEKIEAIEQMKEETKKALQEAETLFQARMDYWFN